MLYRNPETSPGLPRAGLVLRWLRALAPRRPRNSERDLGSLSRHIQRDLGLIDNGLSELADRK